VAHPTGDEAKCSPYRMEPTPAFEGNRNAVRMHNPVRIERAGLRHSPAQMSGRNLMPRPVCWRALIPSQLVALQLAAGA